jgi:hypothetical protein
MTTCHSDFWFIPAEEPHFPLSHDHFEKWAAAIERRISRFLKYAFLLKIT